MALTGEQLIRQTHVFLTVCYERSRALAQRLPPCPASALPHNQLCWFLLVRPLYRPTALVWNAPVPRATIERVLVQLMNSANPQWQDVRGHSRAVLVGTLGATALAYHLRPEDGLRVLFTADESLLVK